MAGVVETRKATDAFTARLKQNKYIDHSVSSGYGKELNKPEAVSFFAKAKKWALGSSNDSDGDKVPAVFCYSLFYVFYD